MSYQPRLMTTEAERTIALPTTIQRALGLGATLAISISGGVDSQALLNALVNHPDRSNWPGYVFAIHADTGRTEWPQTLPHCKRICADAGVDLFVVQRPKGDLVARWTERMEQVGSDRPFWSSSTYRYCTSDLKRAPINKHLRRVTRTGVIISAEGIRAAESAARAKRRVLTIRRKITTRPLEGYTPAQALEFWMAARRGEWDAVPDDWQPRTDVLGDIIAGDAHFLTAVWKLVDEMNPIGRLGFTWYPLLHWDDESVWEQCGTSIEDLHRRHRLYREGKTEEALTGWPCHPAYVYGSSRLSCAMCVLASKRDLEIGARHNPQLYRRLLQMEQESGWTFRQNLSLADLDVNTPSGQEEHTP